MEPQSIAILMPVHDDWPAAGAVLGALDRLLAGQPRWRAEVYLIDDGSTQEPGPEDLPGACQALSAVHRVRLRRNLGHQRAIAVGLAHVYTAAADARAVVVMDADGEDRPEDVLRLLEEAERLGWARIVFAERARRTEGLVFRLGYLGYRALHRVLVGFMTRVGNFSVVPRDRLGQLVVVSELWNHYAAAVYKSRLPLATLPADRGQRLHGRSHMNLVALVVHGLSALAVFGERVSVRLLLFSGALGALALTGAVAGVAAHTSGRWTPPAWIVAAGALGVVLIAQLASTAFLVAFSLLGLRDRLDFVPLRDHQVFVDGVEQVAGA